MTTSLTLDEHLAALEQAGERLVAVAVATGMDAPVPTCPTWKVDALLAHQAMVHRWAAANVRGGDPAAIPSQTTIRSTVADLPAYFRAGLADLLDVLRSAPADLAANRFLNDAPPPREFWARRQAHETTIHMVDALAASLGRLPTSAEVDIGPRLAVDGVDELLRGFFTRGRSMLFDGAEFTVAVVACDLDRLWILHVAERLTVEPDGGRADGQRVECTIRGTAAALYLALWNRGDEVGVEGRTGMLDHWRATQRIRWS